MKTGDLVTRDGGGVGSEETSREGSACDGNLMGNGRGHDDDGGGGTVEYGTIGEGRVDAECSGISAVSGGGGRVKIVAIKKRLAVVRNWMRWFEVEVDKQGLGSQASRANGVWWRIGVAQVYSLVTSNWGNLVSYSRKRPENIRTQGWICL